MVREGKVAVWEEEGERERLVALNPAAREIIYRLALALPACSNIQRD